MTTTHGSQKARIRGEGTTFTLERPARVLEVSRVPAGPLHAIWVVYGDRGLVSIEFEEQRVPTFARERKRAPEFLRAPFADYFAGRALDFHDVPLDLEGTDFQRRVWSALRAIPWGHVASYGQIASRVGSPRGMRAVGLANHRNPIPIVVPCHRVVEASGKLGGFGGGIDRKVALLTLEGMRVDGDRVLPGQLPLFATTST